MKAVLRVMQEVKGMEKNSRVGAGNSAYNGTKDQDVKEVFNEALARNGLAIFPVDIEEVTQLDRWEEVDSYSKQMKTKQSIFTKIKSTYELCHVNGESKILKSIGHGIDNQDKGAGKAMTYALKNCLLYTFLTPVGKIDDTESTHSDDIKTPPAKVKPTLTGDKIDKVNEALAKAEITMEKLEELYTIPAQVKELLIPKK